MNSIAKMFFSKRKQHDVGRRRSNGNRRELGDSPTEQIYAVSDETIKSEHRVKDDPTFFGIWSAL